MINITMRGSPVLMSGFASKQLAGVRIPALKSAMWLSVKTGANFFQAAGHQSATQAAVSALMELTIFAVTPVELGIQKYKLIVVKNAQL